MPLNVVKDKDQFRALYEEYFHTLLAVACQYVNQDVAKDIVQDLFFKLWNQPQIFEKVLEIRYYLYSSVRNRCLDYIRDQKVEAKRLGRWGIESDEFFQEVVLEEEVFIRLRKAVNDLPEKYKSVITLTLEGLKDKEISEKLGLNEEVIRTRKKRGKDILRNSLTDSVLIVLINFL